MGDADNKSEQSLSKSKIQVEKIASLGEFLDDLEEAPPEPKTELSRREIVFEFYERLEAALNKGYSYTKLAELLSKQGVDLSADTLKQYIQEARKLRGKKKKKKQRNKRSVLVKPVKSSEQIESRSVPISNESTESGLMSNANESTESGLEEKPVTAGVQKKSGFVQLNDDEL